MVSDKERTSAAGFAQIKPAAVDLTAKSEAGQTSKGNVPPKNRALLWAALIVLSVSAASVVFLLPNWVPMPSLEVVQTTSISEPGVDAKSPTLKGRGGSAVTPWERAQQSKIRKDTQEILASMLESQETLVDHSVTLWAEAQYKDAMEHAQTGDQLYSLQKFKEAHGEYSSALEIFDELTEQVDVIFEQTMERGIKALSVGEALEAHEAFELALAIDPIDRLALSGAARAESLDEVLALVNEGDQLLKAAQFEEAKAIYEQALAKDDESMLVKRQLTVAEASIRERDFNALMSAGFNALGASQFNKAGKSFSRALKIKPDSADARSAIAQTNQNLIELRIGALLRDGRALEGEEKWHDALAKYDAALEKDGALTDAQVGKKRASLRAQIDDRFVKVFAEPTRLYDSGVYQEITNFHRMVAATANPGPKLKQQIARLAGLLNSASTPVSVQLQSDNLTKVVLYKVGELGYFTSKNLSVRPGRYVALGYREGYRDVRVEFLVESGKPIQTVTIQAQTKVAFGSGS